MELVTLTRDNYDNLVKRADMRAKTIEKATKSYVKNQVEAKTASYAHRLALEEIQSKSLERQLKDARELCEAYRKEKNYLVNRGLFARIFNLRGGY